MMGDIPYKVLEKLSAKEADTIIKLHSKLRRHKHITASLLNDLLNTYCTEEEIAFYFDHSLDEVLCDLFPALCESD